MRSKEAVANIIVSLIYQFIAIISGLIVPRLIISSFGSDVNGLVSSITRFLGYIVLLEAGVGGVVRAALYKPLAEKSTVSISRIIKATEKFFRIIGLIFLGYLLIIAIIFPFMINNDFNSFFTFSLALIIGISTFFQYYFGISYQILLQADQRQYISRIIQIGTMILNTILVILLVKLGFNIHFVKLASSIVFVCRPVLLHIYVNKEYQIIKDVEPDNNAIKQRWDGLGHHIAFLLHNNTDITVLTLFADIKEVSVYSVYYMIVSSIKKLTVTFSEGLEAAFGNMIAKGQKEVLDKNFRIYEFSIFTLTTILFTSNALLILPFVSLYTSGVTDVNYYRPMFAYVLTLAEAIYCIRIPYHSVVLAAGHYKETRNGAFVEAFINIVISIILVRKMGLIGVAIGTIAAMLFRTTQYAVYLSKNIIKRSILVFIKKVIIYSLTTALIVIVVNKIPDFMITSYASWIIYAIEVTIIASLITGIVGVVFYFEEIKNIYFIIKRLFSKRKTAKQWQL